MPFYKSAKTKNIAVSIIFKKKQKAQNSFFIAETHFSSGLFSSFIYININRFNIRFPAEYSIFWHRETRYQTCSIL